MMAVYVDGARNRFRRMIMCHMVADTLTELHAMADRIGMKREWFQPLSFPHYDLSQTRRAMAVDAGAIEVDRRGLVEVMKRFRGGMAEGSKPPKVDEFEPAERSVTLYLSDEIGPPAPDRLADKEE